MTLIEKLSAATGCSRRKRKPDWETIGATQGSAFIIMERKSLWMVEYLRARRNGDNLLAFYRRSHLLEKAHCGS